MKRIIRDRLVTQQEAEKYNKIIQLVQMEYPPVVYIEDFSAYIKSDEKDINQMAKDNPNCFYLVYVDKQFPFVSTLNFDKEFGYYFSSRYSAYTISNVKKFYKIPEKV